MIHLVTREMFEASKKAWGRHTVVLDDQITVKLGKDVTRAQFDLLHKIHSTGVLPCPKPLEFHVITPECNAMFMSTIPGECFDDAWGTLDDDQRLAIAREVFRCLSDLNVAFSNESESITALQGVCEGTAMILPLVNSGNTEAPVSPDAYVETMMVLTPQSPEMVDFQRQILSTLIEKPGNDTEKTTAWTPRLSFCHMDLHPGNILVHNGKLSGIIDWDRAGWYTLTMEKYVMCAQGEYFDEFRKLMLTAWGSPNDPIEELAIYGLRELRFGHYQERERLLDLAAQTYVRQPKRYFKPPIPDASPFPDPAVPATIAVESARIDGELSVARCDGAN